MESAPHRGSPPHPLPTPPDRHKDDDPSPPRVRFAEGDPETIHQPTPGRGSPSAATDTPAPPSVFWEDDRASDGNLAGYTFYREGTPPPPEYETREKQLGYGAGLGGTPGAESSTVGGGTIGSEADFGLPRNHGDASNWSHDGPNENNPATKKRMLWTIVAIGVLVVIGVAVGVGVALGLKNGGSPASEAAEGQSFTTLPSSALNPSPSPTNPPTTSPGGTGGAAGTTSTGSATTSRPTYNSDCPALNNTIYHVPGSTRSFLRLCGVDYSGSGATDLAQVYTGSMADCMNSCASFDQCTACAWGYIEGDEGGEHRCYMKKDLKQPHRAASDWCFAILQ